MVVESIFKLRANKYFTLAVFHVMCQSREGGWEGKHVIKRKGILVGKLESNRSRIPVWAWFREQLTCTRVMAFSQTSSLYKSHKPVRWRFGKTGDKTTSCNLFAKLPQNELNRYVVRFTTHPLKTEPAFKQVVAGCCRLRKFVEQSREWFLIKPVDVGCSTSPRQTCFAASVVKKSIVYVTPA